ncbi:MAG: hypothetical protein JO360_09920 [Acidobacteria bacterium]|nr:hypothetical protein [Acidobacteriota bacterium]
MSADTKTFLKLAWTLAAIGCFIFPLILIPSSDSVPGWVERASVDMSFGMLVLSFPAGLLYLLAVAFLLHAFMPFNVPVSLYVVLWFGFFVMGYLQWFHLLPGRFRREGLTTLGLDEKEAVATSRRPHRPRRRRKSAPAQLTEKQVLPFEATRRTPLERVISES